MSTPTPIQAATVAALPDAIRNLVLSPDGTSLLASINTALAAGLSYAWYVVLGNGASFNVTVGTGPLAPTQPPAPPNDSGIATNIGPVEAAELALEAALAAGTQPGIFNAQVAYAEALLNATS